MHREQRSRPDATSSWSAAPPRLALAALVAIAALALGAAPALARGASHRDRSAAAGHGWVGTWSSAEVPAAASGLSATGFDDQTVRDVVHTSVGGSQIRIRLSNVFGTAPLTVDDVHVGLRSSGAAVVAGSDRQVRFRGSRQTTIAAGARRFSDPIKLPVGAGQDLVVSIYFAGATGPATWHPDAISTNYYAAGDQSADASGTPYTSTDTSWYFLDGVDVLNPAVRGAVVTFGPSTTDGDASTTDADERYPDDLAGRLVALPAGRRMSVLNAGISGNQLLADGGTSGVSGLSRFERDAIDQTGVRDIIIWEGSNDIGNNPGLQAGQLTDGYAQLIRLAHEHGIRVIGATLQPDEGAGYYTTAGNEVREAVNDWIRTSGAFDGVADFSTVLEDPANPDQLDPPLDSGDHLHPNDAGYQAIADSIDLQLLTGPARPSPFSGYGTASAPSATIATGATTQETVTIHSLSASTRSLPWTVSAGHGIHVTPSRGTVRVPAGATATVTLTVNGGADTGSYPVTFNALSTAGESALAVPFTVVVATPGDLTPFYDNVGISDDGAIDQANLDGNGYSYSEQQLTAAGLAPGATVTSEGLTYTWPDVAAGQPDNVEAEGQTIVVKAPAGATELGFLGAGANSGTTGSQGELTIHYTDGTSTTEELGLSGYALGFTTTVDFGNAIVATLPYQNDANGTERASKMYVLSQTVALDPAKTVASVTLPSAVDHGQLHVFAVAAG